MTNLWLLYMTGHGDTEHCSDAWHIQMICIQKTCVCVAASFACSVPSTGSDLRLMDPYAAITHLINVVFSGLNEFKDGLMDGWIGWRRK